MQVKDRIISENEPVFVIAEVGNQFGGSLPRAKELVDACVEAKADAIKFFFWFPSEFMAEDSEYSYEGAQGKMVKVKSMKELLGRYTLSIYEWWELHEYCQRKGIIFMSTVLTPKGIDYTKQLKMPAIKISSWDYNFTMLWEWIGKMGLPVFVDTGPAYLDEILRNLRILWDGGCRDICLLHCFHTEVPSQMNMLAIPYMKNFGVEVGYSAAGRDDTTDIMAVTLGANVLEKRLTIDRNDGFLHSWVSKEPDEFREYVKLMREVQDARGEMKIKPSVQDINKRKLYYRHLVADGDIMEGQIILYRDLEAKRGLHDVSPEDIRFFVGRRAKRNIARNTPIKFDDV